MLMPEQVVVFLEHEQKSVRNLAADYLAEAHDTGPATAEDLQRAIDRYGVVETRRLISSLSKLRHTDQSLLWMVQQLELCKSDHGAICAINNAICKLDYDLLIRHWPTIRDSRFIFSETKNHLEQYLALQDESAEELWEGLMQFCADHVHHYFQDFDELVPWRRVNSLAQLGDEEIASRCLKIIRDKTINDWREWFAVELLGAMRYQPAVNDLIELLRGDVEEFAIQICDSLVQIGDVDVIETVADMYSDESWDFRLFTPRLFNGFKDERSEQALLRLIQNEPKDNIRAFLGTAMCELCCDQPESIEFLRTLCLTENYDRQVVDLKELVLPLSVMVGYDLPEAKQWRKYIEQEKGKREKRAEEFLRGYSPAKSPNIEIDDLPPPPMIETFTRIEPKIGRNDPCPCGSGRKYKKCCLPSGMPV